jgi:toxin ParE1/3/4
MRLRVELHPSAREEFEAAYRWYRDRGIDVALRFLREIERAIERVSEEPSLGQPYLDDCRRFVCHRFPFLLIYRVRGPVLQVIAIAHGRRRPGYWRRR